MIASNFLMYIPDPNIHSVFYQFQKVITGFDWITVKEPNHMNDSFANRTNVFKNME